MSTILDRPTPAGPPLRKARMLIDGEWQGSMGGEAIAVENPATKRTIGEVPCGQAADVDLAVAAATSAFQGWRRIAPRDRGRMLTRIADAMEARVEEFAHLLALETGNAIRTQARDDLQHATHEGCA